MIDESVFAFIFSVLNLIFFDKKAKNTEGVLSFIFFCKAD